MDGTKIRVLHMGLDNRRGGIESFLYNTACNIDWSRFQFDFLCYGDDPAFKEELHSMGARLTYMPPRRNLIAYASFLKKVLCGYDILHLHKNSPGDFLPVLVAHDAGVKVIVHAHNTAANRSVPELIARLGRRAFNKYADLELACSEPAGEYVFGKGAEFRFFPNAINLADYAYDPKSREKLRRELGISSDAFVVGIVGRLVSQKNYLFMIRAFAAFKKLHPDSALVCVGDGELHCEIVSLAASLGVSDSVMLLGRREDVQRLYSVFDCACCPSNYEGFSFFVLEAQASGLPCLVSDAVPPQARVTDLVQLVSLEEDAWAAALAALSSCRIARSGLSDAGDAAMQTFDVVNAGRKLMSVYDKLMAGGHFDDVI